MDLGAYIQISDLEFLAKANNIEVERLRGYRLMREEKPVNIEQICNDQEVELCEELCCMYWNPTSIISAYGPETKALCQKFINNFDDKYNSDKKAPLSINWDAMSDTEKEILRNYIEARCADYKKQWELWNSFCGRNDVLYIHAKQGTSNWSATTFHDYEDKPWFLGACNDGYDSCYCDIYAKIEPFTGKLNECESEE